MHGWAPCLVVAFLAAAQAFDCSRLAPDLNRPEYTIDLSRIRMPATLSEEYSTPPSTTRSEVAVDLCRALPRQRRLAAQDQCAQGTHVCLTTKNIKGSSERIEQVIATGAVGRDGDMKARVADYARTNGRDCVYAGRHC